MSEQAKQRMMATIAFSGEFGDPEWTNDPKFDIRLDVDAAAAELRQAWLRGFSLAGQVPWPNEIMRPDAPAR